MKPSVSASGDSFAIFFSGLRRRDDDAWQELIRRYTCRLIGLARNKLDVRLGQVLDPDDIVQSVYRLLDQRLQGRGLHADSWNHLWAMLAVLTVQRCNNWYRHYFGTEKRQLETSLAEGEEGESESSEFRDARAPTPDEAAELAEQVRWLLPSLDAQTAKIYWLGMLGFADGEIAHELDVTEARVRFARQDCLAVLTQTLGNQG